MTASGDGVYRELAERDQGGIVVRLLWDARGDRVVIRYRDDHTGDAFVAEVPKTQALTAFRHPNAYRTYDALAE
jgi:YD repeat-containing protein